MKKLCILSFILAISLQSFAENRLAFPTAEGAGRYTWGGRGGQVLVVNRLDDDSNPGSLRWAVEQSGARTVIFDVSGDIILNSALRITNDSITIAGQTAPGDGITIRNHTVFNAANQVIVRFMRFRPGDELGVEIDAFEGRGQSDIILDHLSMSWANDEIASWYNNRNFTMQWSILSEPLGDAGHERGVRGYAGLWGGNPGTFHHNLIAHSARRNPRLNGVRLRFWDRFGAFSEQVDFVNNVVYNWGDTENAYGGEGGRYNFLNNYFKPGPATPHGLLRERFMYAWARVDRNPGGVGEFVDYGWFYMGGNVMHGNPTLTADNWSGTGMVIGNPVGGSSNRNHIDSVRVFTPFLPLAVNLRSAEEAFDVVLARSGASHRRDAVDERIIRETRTGIYTYGSFGFIDSQTEVGGWPELRSKEPAPRTLRGTPHDDGIPDWFKIQHNLPLNENVANRYDLSDIYTNLEMYLNSLVANIHP